MAVSNIFLLWQHAVNIAELQGVGRAVVKYHWCTGSSIMYWDVWGFAGKWSETRPHVFHQPSSMEQFLEKSGEGACHSFCSLSTWALSKVEHLESPLLAHGDHCSSQSSAHCTEKENRHCIFDRKKCGQLSKIHRQTLSGSDMLQTHGVRGTGVKLDQDGAWHEGTLQLFKWSVRAPSKIILPVLSTHSHSAALSVLVDKSVHLEQCYVLYPPPSY